MLRQPRGSVGPALSINTPPCTRAPPAAQLETCAPVQPGCTSGGVSYRGTLSRPRRQTREALCPGAVYDSPELETAGGPISRGLHSTQETGVCPRVAGRRLRTGRGFLCADRKPSQSPASSKGGRHRPGRSPPSPVHDMLACQASRLSKKTFEDLIVAAFRERRCGQEWGDLPSHVLSKS